MGRVTQVNFKSENQDKEILLRMANQLVKDITEDKVADLAIATVMRSDTGPMMYTNFYGQCQFGTLIGAVSVLKHDMIEGME